MFAASLASPAADRVRLSKRVNATIDRALTEQRLVGGAVLIAQDGEIVFRRAYGYADREERRPARIDTIFRFSSLTKPIVTAAVMRLIEQGMIRLDDSVSRWLAEFRPKLPNGSEPTITVRHLLTHTAGLTYRFFQPARGPYERAGVSDGLAEPGLSMENELKLLAAVPLSFAPGTAWGYSLALDVLGEVLSLASGKPLPVLIEQLVTTPLSMRDTGFIVHDPNRLATPYVDATPPRRMRDPDSLPFGEGAGIRFALSRLFDPRSFASGGAGMVGTATDFLTFLETLRQGGGTVLTQESVHAMMSNQIGQLRINVEQTPSWGFGFGGAVLIDPRTAGVPQAAGTWKWGGVYGHHWYVDPTNHLSVVALSNTAVEGMSGRFVDELMEAIYGAKISRSKGVNPTG
jgi:CubicO group peptidase (beta-lactamase class C family)